MNTDRTGGQANTPMRTHFAPRQVLPGVGGDGEVAAPCPERSQQPPKSLKRVSGGTDSSVTYTSGSASNADITITAANISTQESLVTAFPQAQAPGGGRGGTWARVGAGASAAAEALAGESSLREEGAALAELDTLPTSHVSEYEMLEREPHCSPPEVEQRSSDHGDHGTGERGLIGGGGGGGEFLDVQNFPSVDTEADGGDDGSVLVEPFEQSPLEIVVKPQQPLLPLTKKAAVSGYEGGGRGDAGVSGSEREDDGDSEGDADNGDEPGFRFDSRRQSRRFSQLSAAGRRASATVRNTVSQRFRVGERVTPYSNPAPPCKRMNERTNEHRCALCFEHRLGA